VTAAIFGLLGVALGIGSQWLLHRHDRDETLDDRLHTERREAYTALLVSANECGQALGSVAPGHGYGESGGEVERQQAAYAVDRDFTPRFRAIELVGSSDAIDAATELRERLLRFRDRMTRGEGEPPSYASTEYEKVYEPFQQARDKFIAVARRELKEGAP
jgi:hypothetical protein